VGKKGQGEDTKETEEADLAGIGPSYFCEVSIHFPSSLTLFLPRPLSPSPFFPPSLPFTLPAVAPPSRHVTTRPGFAKVTSRVRSNWAVIQEGREEDWWKKANMMKGRKGKARAGEPASSISSTSGGVSSGSFYVPGIAGFPFAVDGVSFPSLSLLSAPTRSQTPTPMEMMGGGVGVARGEASTSSSPSFGARMGVMPTAEMGAFFVRDEEGMGGREGEGEGGYGRGRRGGGRGTRVGTGATRVQLPYVAHGLPQMHLLGQEEEEGGAYGDEDEGDEQDEGKEGLEGYSDRDEEDEDEVEEEEQEEEDESWEDMEDDDDDDDEEAFHERGDQKEDGQDEEQQHQKRQEQQEQQHGHQHQHHQHQHHHHHLHLQHKCRHEQQQQQQQHQQHQQQQRQQHGHHHHHQQQQQQQQKSSQTRSPVVDFLADPRSVSQIIPNFPPPPVSVDLLNKANSIPHWPDASSLLPLPLVIFWPSSEKTLHHVNLAERREGGRDGQGGGNDASTPALSALFLRQNEGREKLTTQMDAHDDSVQRLPSLASPFPGPPPCFDESTLLDVFEEAGRRGVC